MKKHCILCIILCFAMAVTYCFPFGLQIKESKIQHSGKYCYVAAEHAADSSNTKASETTLMSAGTTPSAITASPSAVVATSSASVASATPSASTATTSATAAPATTSSVPPATSTTPTVTPTASASPTQSTVPATTPTNTPVIPTFTPKPIPTVQTAAPKPSKTAAATPTISVAPPVTPEPTPNMQNLVNITVEYVGAAITSPTTITKDDLIVTAYYSSGATRTISAEDYSFLSSTVITAPGNYIITVFFSGLKSSCNVLYDDGTLPSYYTINFNSNGGSEIPSITGIAPNSTVPYPGTPVYYGYIFRGWFTSPDFTTEFSEYDKINSNMTLYAKWEMKEDPDKDIFTVYNSYETYTVAVKADLTGQKYGRYVNLRAEPIEASLISDLCKSVCPNSNYFGIGLDIYDYVFSEQTPVLISILIPPTFDISKVAVYYTTNNKTIAGKMQGTVTHSDTTGLDTFSFYAYAPGNYIVAETNKVQTTPTATPTAKPYLTMSSLGKMKMHAQTAPNLKLHNSSTKLSKYTLKWSSSNPSVASVSKDGIVTAKSVGSATITVRSTDGVLSASQKVYVTTKKPITKLTLNVSKKTLKKGKSFQIKASIKPKKATKKTLKYISSKPAVAKVTKKGKVKAKKKGSCTITVKTTDGSRISKKIKIKVKK